MSSSSGGGEIGQASLICLLVCPSIPGESDVLYPSAHAASRPMPGHAMPCHTRGPSSGCRRRVLKVGQRRHRPACQPNLPLLLALLDPSPPCPLVCSPVDPTLQPKQREHRANLFFFGRDPLVNKLRDVRANGGQRPSSLSWAPPLVCPSPLSPRAYVDVRCSCDDETDCS